MKTFLPIIFLTLCALLLLSLIALESSMLMDINRTQKRENEYLKMENEKLKTMIYINPRFKMYSFKDSAEFRSWFMNATPEEIEKCLDSLKIQIR